MIEAPRWQQPSYAQRFLLLPRATRWLVTLAVLLFIASWSRKLGVPLNPLRSRTAQDMGGKDAISNNTLGFQEIFAIILPHRQDRARPLLAAASATNLTISVFDAIADANASKELDIPPAWGQNGWEAKEGQLGCFASHHRIWKKIVDENIASSLILESDTDWDMRIKSGMSGFSNGVKAILDSIPTPPASALKHPRDFSPLFSSPLSPYGQDWDLLWIGHCGAQGERYYAYHDPSAADSRHSWSYYSPPPEIAFRPASTRLVFQMSDLTEKSIVCTAGYAISNRGAKKLEKLFWTADREVDIWMRERCAREEGMVCISTFPQVFASANSPSNIAYDGDLVDASTMETVTGGHGIQISARVNAVRGLGWRGEGEWRREWGNEGLWALDNGAVRDEGT